MARLDRNTLHSTYRKITAALSPKAEMMRQLALIIQIGAGSALALVLNVTLARLLSPHAFGTYSIATTSITVCAWMAVMGFDLIAVRHTIDTRRTAGHFRLSSAAPSWP